MSDEPTFTDPDETPETTETTEADSGKSEEQAQRETWRGADEDI